MRALHHLRTQPICDSRTWVEGGHIRNLGAQAMTCTIDSHKSPSGTCGGIAGGLLLAISFIGWPCD